MKKSVYEQVHCEGIGMTLVMPMMTQAVKEVTLQKMRLFGCVGKA